MDFAGISRRSAGYYQGQEMGTMAITPIKRYQSEQTETANAEGTSWLGYAAGGALVAAGLLMFSGRRKAGMVAAASGAALVVMDQKETLERWWSTLPEYIDDVQKTLDQVQKAVETVDVQRERVSRVLNGLRAAQS